MEPAYTFHYETEANASFLVAVLGNSGDLVRYQLKMLENNQIANLLEVRSYQQDGEVSVCYNVTSRLPLTQMLSRQKMKKEDFLTLLKGLTESYEELAEYQLPGRGLLLNEAYMFVRPDSFEPSFVYLPIYTEDEGLDDLRRFVRKMVLESHIAITNDDFIQRMLDLMNDEDLTLDQLAEKLGQLKTPAHVQRETPPPAPPKPPVFEPPVPVAPQPAEIPERAEPKSRKGAAKAGKKKEKQPKKEKKGTSKGSLIFTVLQAVIILTLALAVRSGFFLLEGGGWNIPYLAGFLIAVAGLDVVVYRELFVNHKEEQQKKPSKKGGAKTKASKKTSMKKEKEAARQMEEITAPVQPVEVSPVPVAPVPPVAVPPAYVPPVSPVDDQGPDTVLDDSAPFLTGYLEYFENGLVMRIHLDRDVTRVGQLRQRVDYVLDSPKVSKVHAEFLRQGDRYFVRDLNSTNGTYINGDRQRIVCNQDVELHDGDRVRLANVELTFKC